MRFCSLKVQNLVLKIDLVNRPRVVYSRAYGNKNAKSHYSHNLKKLDSENHFFFLVYCL